MRILLKVTSSSEDGDGGCEYALVDLSPELAALVLQRVAALRDQMTLDPNIDQTSYWACFVACYFSPYADMAIPEANESASLMLGDPLDELQIEDREIVCVPEIFQVRSSLIAAAECEKLLVRADSITFSAIPKHASFYVQTVEIPPAMLEAALAICPSTTQA